jgi:hypothetical protein
MAPDATPSDSNLPVAFATWVYLLHGSGVEAGDEELTRHCAALDQATDRAAGDRAGEALMRRMAGLLGGSELPADAVALGRRLYGDRVGDDLGRGDRDERTARIRKYQFGRNLPWLARIWERRDGRVQPTWLLIERVTDQVTAMDPNPWDDVDEERRLPVADFQVLWELDTCSALYLA